MFLRDDEELFSIGAVAILEETGEPDTTSDVSNWVRQYTEWEEFEPLHKSASTGGLCYPGTAPFGTPTRTADRTKPHAAIFS